MSATYRWDRVLARQPGGYPMTSAEKRELKEKLTAKGITLDKAGEAVKVPGSLLALYLTEDSNPVPKRIVEGLKKLLA